ncbi:MAG: pseudouridine synthase [Lachnospiraceae bacterium]|nr:pseudouridine synthase [Lachnospiraceae bacterium]
MENEGKRLNKYISDSGYASRRAADALIAAGKVEIQRKHRKDEPENQPFRAKLGDRVFNGDTVFVEGNELPKKEAKKIYIALNKPKGIICTGDSDVPNNVISYLGITEKITYAGRLDKDSEGLLLLTNDGDLIEKITQASHYHEKEYIVTVDKVITESFIYKMKNGVKIRLDDDRNLRGAAARGQDVRYVTTRPCRVKKLDEHTFSITLTQGYNRQIRRMCAALTYSVKSIKRVRICSVRLSGLKTGETRKLTKEEVESLKS